ncbi:CD59 glycoprotein-like [Callorhinchus milii]|uniref:CD59 glycoprotein-like n=1 Tax=Callorhinchus milii TaxID=7868 RepID=UPI001C3FCD1B|nr:CD59 glycoprotein-like [Callorhinchus milii]
MLAVKRMQAVLLLLPLCWSLGFALQCYNCRLTVNRGVCPWTNCKGNQDTCLNVTHPSGQLFRQCWKREECEQEFIRKAFRMDSGMEFNCCSRNLCNSGSWSRAPPLLGLGLGALLAALASWLSS